MALLDEQLVEEWLNRQKFFTMRGIKTGNDEIDLLAIRYTADDMDCWHVEVQVSFKPIGYIGGDNNARQRTAEEINEGIATWVEKKYLAPNKVAKRTSIFAKASWRYVFVHGNVRDAAELTCLQTHDIHVLSYQQIIQELKADAQNNSSSTASNIVEILKYGQ